MLIMAFPRFLNTNTLLRLCQAGQLTYRNVPKFSDRQVWANSVDPDQTAPRGAV